METVGRRVKAAVKRLRRTRQQFFQFEIPGNDKLDVTMLMFGVFLLNLLFVIFFNFIYYFVYIFYKIFLTIDTNILL